MGLYEQIMRCENRGLGDALDDRLTEFISPVVSYFKEKYGYGFHTSVAMLRTGTMPHHEKHSVKELAYDIFCAIGPGLSNQYIPSTVTPRLSKKFGIDFTKIKYDPKPSEHKRHLEYESRKSQYGVCMECNGRFAIDTINHPANLCVCTQCAPSGIYYGATSNTNSPFGNADYKNSKKGSTK